MILSASPIYLPNTNYPSRYQDISFIEQKSNPVYLTQKCWREFMHNQPATVQELLSKPDFWIKGVEVATINGVCKYCLAGALTKVYGFSVERTEARRKVLDAIKQTDPDSYMTKPQLMVEYNDAPERTFEDIRRVIELANV